MEQLTKEQTGKWEVCKLFWEQERDKAIAEGKTAYKASNEVVNWIKDKWGVSLKPKTVAKQIERERKRLATPVGKTVEEPKVDQPAKPPATIASITFEQLVKRNQELENELARTAEEHAVVRPKLTLFEKDKPKKFDQILKKGKGKLRVMFDIWNILSTGEKNNFLEQADCG